MNLERTILIFFGMLIFLSGKAQIKSDWAFSLNDMNPVGGNIAGTCIKRDASGNLYVTGHFLATADFDPGAGVFNMTSKGGSDIFIAKYDASGNLIFSKGFGSPSDDWGTSLAVDGSGNIYLTGYFLSTADFDPGPGTASLVSAGNRDIFIAKYDASGNYIFAKNIGGISDDWSYSIELDNTGNAYFTGYFINTVDFDAGTGVANLTSAGDRDVYIAKYDGNGNFITAINVGGTGADQANCVTLDAYGNVFITGFFYGTADFDPLVSGTANFTSFGLGDIFVAKYDASLAYVNAFQMGGIAAESGTSIKIDGSDNILVAGTYMGTVDFDPQVSGTANRTVTGGSDVFVAKYNSAGVLNYAISMGGASFEGCYSLAVDASGNAYITGTMQGTCDFDPGAGTANLTSSGGDDIFMAKYDASGIYLYAKRFGRTSSDYGNSITADDAGNAIITGYFTGGTVDFDPGAGTANLVAPASLQNAFVGKYDSGGNYLMAFSLGGYSGTTVNQTNSKVVSDNAGNMFLTGSFSGTIDFDPGPGNAYLTSVGQNDIYLAKYDPSGNYVFAFRIGGAFNEEAYSVFVDGSGNVYITGYFDGIFDFDPGTGTANLTGLGDVYFAKYSPTGDYIFAKSISGTSSDYGYSVFVDDTENIYLTGSFQGTVDFDPDAGTINLVSAGNSDVFIAKYDPSGAFIFAKGFGGTGDDRGQALTIDETGNILVTGFFNGTSDFDPGVGSADLVSAGNQDIFIAKYNNSGDYISAGKIGGSSTDYSYSIAYDGSSSFYICGYYIGTCDFDPGVGTFNLSSNAASADFFLAKYDNSLNMVFANSFGGTSGDFCYSASIDHAGDIYVTGGFGGLVDFDPGIATGNLTASGSSDIFLAKYNASGNLIFAKNIGGTSSESGNYVHAGVDSTVFLTGYFQTVADFDPGVGVDELISLNGNDIFAAKYIPSYPEIAVSGNSEFIFDDDATPSLTDDSDFGNSNIGFPVVHTFVIENNGEADLILNGIPAVSVTGTGFALSVDAPPIIAPGTAVSFEVTFTPDNCGLFNGNISIANNDPDENPFNFSITGNGIDNVAPSVPVLTNITTECSYNPVYPDDYPTTPDGCDGVIIGTPDVVLPIENQGETIILWTFTDSNGNYISVSQSVTIDDLSAPVPDETTLPQINEFCQVESLTLPTATDNCNGVITATTNAVFPLSESYTLIEWTFDDGNGNVFVQNQEVYVFDNESPVPDDSSLPFYIGECFVLVTVFPTATDNCSGTITAITDDTLFYDVPGNYSITWSFSDENGNVSTQTQMVQVGDQLPVPAEEELPVIYGECFAQVTDVPIAHDCGETIYGTTSESLYYDSPGTYTITWLFEDETGNIVLQEQTVVVSDSEPPVPSVTDLPDISAECNLTVETYPTASDNCGATITATTSDPLYYDVQGTYYITWSYDDGNGNITEQIQTVLIEDVTTPELTCTADIVINLGEGETEYTVTAGELDPIFAWDNCVIALMENDYNYSPSLAGSVLPVGTYVVYWSVFDNGGNSSNCYTEVIVNPYVGANNPVNEEVKLYPNPTFGELTVVLTGNHNEIVLTDISGKTIFEASTVENSVLLDLSAYSSGMYFVKIKNENSIYIFKIVKK